MGLSPLGLRGLLIAQGQRHRTRGMTTTFANVAVAASSGTSGTIGEIRVLF